MKIFVTGGSGFIGSYFLRALRDLGHSIVNYDLIAPKTTESDIEFIRGDVRDEKLLTRSLNGCDSVLHLAAAHHDFGIAPETYQAVNVDAATAMCSAMVENGINRLCFFSSVAVYGDSKADPDENTVPSPVNPYGETKLAAEGKFRIWTEEDGGRQCLIIRPTITFGPGNFANMFTLINSIDRNRFLQVGSGANFKSLSYVENLVAATIYLWLKNGDKRQKVETVNYVDKPDMTSSEIARNIYSALGKSQPKIAFPYSVARLLAIPLDILIWLTGKNLPISGMRIRKLAKLETRYQSQKIRDLGYVQPTELKEGIRRMVQWYESEGKQTGRLGVNWPIPPREAVICSNESPVGVDSKTKPQLG